MNIEYKFLTKTPVSIIHKTMIEAFSDYQIDMTYMTPERFKKRAKLGRVDFSCSVGAFAHGKLVGFTNIGIDNYKGELSAYDAGTGIIKDFRGQGIAGKMFEFAIPKLKKLCVTKFYLEVLQENKPAIRAYEKAGFKIDREFLCYKAEIEKVKKTSALLSDIQIKNIPQHEIKNFRHLFLQENAWESNIHGIENASEDILILGGFKNAKCVGIISFYPTLEWIMVLGYDLHQKPQNIETLLLNSLLEKISGFADTIKMGNLVPENPLNNFFIKNGFELCAKQFEMVFELY